MIAKSNPTGPAEGREPPETVREALRGIGEATSVGDELGPVELHVAAEGPRKVTERLQDGAAHGRALRDPGPQGEPGRAACRAAVQLEVAAVLELLEELRRGEVDADAAGRADTTARQQQRP